MLRSAGTSFRQAADGLASLQAAASLGDAAAAVPSSQIAVAAQSEVASETTPLAAGARRFGENLGTAARWYERRDQAAAEAIEKADSASAASR